MTFQNIRLTLIILLQKILLLFLKYIKRQCNSLQICINTDLAVQSKNIFI